MSSDLATAACNLEQRLQLLNLEVCKLRILPVRTALQASASRLGFL